MVSLLSLSESEQITEQSIGQNSETDLGSLEDETYFRNSLEENKLKLSHSDYDPFGGPIDMPIPALNSDSNDVSGIFNTFRGQHLNKVDIQLTSQILSSIRSKIAANIRSQSEVTSDYSEHFDADFVAVKQELPDELLDFHHSSQEVFTYPQISQPVYQNSCNSISSCSTPSLESFNPSPDSSVFPTFPPVSFPTSSMSHDGLSVDQCSASQSVFNQNILPRSEQSLDVCDSSQPAVIVATKPVTKQNNLLPPCRVCGEKASGFHYGANTCEACKGFFRRSLKKDMLDFKCNGDNTCKIQKGRRNNCSLCRYNRCLSAGMSKQAIKTGRYTHEKRTQDIVEVKTLNGELGPREIQTFSIKTEHPPKLVTKRFLSVENRALVDHIFAAHKAIFPFWHSVLDTGSNKVVSQRYAEKYEREKMLKAEASVTQDLTEETDSYSDTKGVEPTGQRDTIEELTNHIELAVIAFVRFAKAVPGFTDLSLNDQASLVKLSRFEIWMIGAHKFMDLNLKVVSGPRGRSYHIEELNEVLDEGYVYALFTFSKSLQEIQLTNEETALLKCIALTFSDRSDLQAPDKVQRIQQRLTECLEELLGNGQRFAKVMNSLVRLRNLTEWSKRISESMMVEWPHIKKHPLLLEIMSV